MKITCFFFKKKLLMRWCPTTSYSRYVSRSHILLDWICMCLLSSCSVTFTSSCSRMITCNCALFLKNMIIIVVIIIIIGTLKMYISWYKKINTLLPHILFACMFEKQGNLRFKKLQMCGLVDEQWHVLSNWMNGRVIVDNFKYFDLLARMRLQRVLFAI